MAHRDQIVSYLDDLLDVGAYPDMTPNGLQVPGADTVAPPVDDRALVERAVAEGPS